MIQTWGVGDSINGASWSVSVEWAAYFIFPFIFAPILKINKIIPFLSFFTSFFMLIIIIKLGQKNLIQRKGPLDIFDPHSSLPLIRCISEFIIGMICYRISFSHFSFIRSKTISIIISFLTLFSLFLSEFDVFSVFLFSVLLITLTNESNPLSRIMAWTPIYYLGVWSYSIYLWHRSFLFIIGDVWNGHHNIIRPTAVLIMLLIVSCLSYYFIEKPWQKKIRRIEQILFRKSDQRIKISEQIGVNNL